MSSIPQNSARPFAVERNAALIVFIFGLVVILTAWGFEIIGGYKPCPLCLEQRNPYYVGLPVAFIAFIAAAKGGSKNLVYGALILTALIFAYSVYLAVFHSGVEWGFWEGPAGCAGDGNGVVSDAGNLLGALGGEKVVSCTDAAGRFLGLSFAGWNAVASFFLMLTASEASLRFFRKAEAQSEA